MMQFSRIVLFLLTVVILKVECQYCLKTDGNYESRDLEDYAEQGWKSATIPLGRQVIIASYKFYCYGNITEWMLALNTTEYGTITSLQFQVWRPSPSVKKTGCYGLVGSNEFTTVELNTGIVFASPLPGDEIQFQPGDVLGFYVEDARGGDAGVATLGDFSDRGNRRHEREEVWFGNVPSIIINPDPDCLLSVGPNKHLNTFTNTAPVFSVSYDISATTEMQEISTTKTHTVTQMNNKSTTGTEIAGSTLATVIVILITIILLVVVALSVKSNRKQFQQDNDNSQPTVLIAFNALYGRTLKKIMPVRGTNDPNYDYPTTVWKTAPGTERNDYDYPTAVRKTQKTASGTGTTDYDYATTVQQTQSTSSGRDTNDPKYDYPKQQRINTLPNKAYLSTTGGEYDN